jgi:hypothetical protein
VRLGEPGGERREVRLLDWAELNLLRYRPVQDPRD